MKSPLLVIFLALSSTLWADYESDQKILAKCKGPYTYYPIIEAKAGYFTFSQHKMRKMFDEGGVDLQFSVSFPFWHYLQLYTSVEYLERSGKAGAAREKINIQELPLSLGLKLCFPITSFADYYVTLGPRYFFVHIKNNAISSSSNQNGLGGFANTGFIFYFNQTLFLDLFAEYSAKELSFHGSAADIVGSSAQVGGPTFGGGLGLRF